VRRKRTTDAADKRGERIYERQQRKYSRGARAKREERRHT
jgi:hypothetical protein